MSQPRWIEKTLNGVNRSFWQAEGFSCAPNGTEVWATDVNGNLPGSADPIYVNVKDYGAVGDDSTDDTEAFQDAFDALGTSLSGAIFVPVGNYKITNTLFKEGSTGNALHLIGEIGGVGGRGAVLKWYGHAGAGMFYGLGLNGLTVEDIEFTVDTTSTRMKWGMWLDSTNTYAATVTVNTTSLVRASNIVTVTTSTAHSLTPGMVVRIAGASDTTFNGTFIVLTAPTTTTATWIQTGLGTSTAGGTTSKYKSTGSSNTVLRGFVVQHSSAAAKTISAISRDGSAGTVVLTADHYAVPGDKIYISGVTDTTYNGYYYVSTIVSATSLTYTDTQIAGSSSGGTMLPDSYGLAIANNVVVSTPQVSEITLYDVAIKSSLTGTSLHGVHVLTGGNVKNFAIYRGTINGFNIGVDWGKASGTFLVDGLILAGNTSYDFVTSAAQLTLIGVESESVLTRFLTGTTGSNPGQVNLFGCCIQVGLDTDDILISWTGTLQLIGNKFQNNRIVGTTYPKLQMTPIYGATDAPALISLGNHYNNAPAGYVPVYDSSANQYLTGTGANANKASMIMSFGDSGGTGGSMLRLGTVMPVMLVTPVAFANVPSSPREGMEVAVIDSTTATWGATITGGGGNHVQARYNGSNWTVMGA